jgi:hypothetical protein
MFLSYIEFRKMDKFHIPIAVNGDIVMASSLPPFELCNMHKHNNSMQKKTYKNAIEALRYNSSEP